MKNRLKKLNIFFIVLCIIISSIIPTAAFAASEDDLRSSVVSIASDESATQGHRHIQNTAIGTVIKADGAQRLYYGALIKRESKTALH